jgi:hypothetical protein
MPEKLYNKLSNRMYLAESIINVKPQPLDADDIMLLQDDLSLYGKHINDLDTVDLSTFIKIAPPPFVPKVVEGDKVQLVPFWNEKSSMPYEPPSTEQIIREKDSCGVGLLVNRTGTSTRDLVNKALRMIASFAHRGSVPAEANTGDGCGITFYGTHSFFEKCFPDLNLQAGKYGVVMLKTENRQSAQVMKELLIEENLEVIGKRRVETDPSVLGPVGLQYECTLKQYIVVPKSPLPRHELEKALVRMRLRFEFNLQSNTSKTRPHIFSASTYHVSKLKCVTFL